MGGGRYSNGRELSPPTFSYRKNGEGDFSYRDVVSVTRSVTGRAAELPLLSAGFSSKAGQRSRFMTLVTIFIIPISENVLRTNFYH
jgi:hypothetical protein